VKNKKRNNRRIYYRGRLLTFGVNNILLVLGGMLNTGSCPSVVTFFMYDIVCSDGKCIK